MNIGEYEKQINDYCSEIMKYLISRGISVQDAQDSVQDTVVKILELDIFIDPLKLRSWMYRVSIRNYINKYNRNKKYQLIINELAKVLADTTIAEKENIDVKHFLRQLKPYEERILSNYYFKQLSVKSLAQIEGVSISKIKVDLYRARKKLRKNIEKEEVKLWNNY